MLRISVIVLQCEDLLAHLKCIFVNAVRKTVQRMAVCNPYCALTHLFHKQITLQCSEGETTLMGLGGSITVAAPGSSAVYES